jgi:hypothetical protein
MAAAHSEGVSGAAAAVPPSRSTRDRPGPQPVRGGACKPRPLTPRPRHMTTIDKIAQLAAAIAIGAAMAALLLAYDWKAMLYGLVICVFTISILVPR